MTTIHKFEAAGLGIAPFRYVGFFVRHYACEFCGTAIQINCRVADSNGKEFIVGSDCIMKVGDAGLTRSVDAMRKKMRKEAITKRINDFAEIMRYDCVFRSKVNQLPHPNGWEGKTLLMWADWMLENAGVAGKTRAAREVLSSVLLEDIV